MCPAGALIITTVLSGRDVDKGGGCACVCVCGDGRGYMGILCTPLHFAVKHKLL